MKIKFFVFQVIIEGKGKATSSAAFYYLLALDEIAPFGGILDYASVTKFWGGHLNIWIQLLGE